MKKLYLIRHAKTQGNLEKRYIGKTDESLSVEGVLELMKRKSRYREADIVFTSPMKRCIETADIIYENTQKHIVHELRECDFGIFENKTYEELKHNAHYIKWLDSGGKGEIPEGEDSISFKKRCQNAFVNILNTTDGYSSIAIVAHGGTIMGILEQLAPTGQDFYHWQIENCGFFELDIENKKIVNIKKCVSATQM